MFENLLRLGAIVRRRLAVTAHHLQLKDNLLHLALARHRERQEAACGFALSLPDRPPENPASIFCEWLAENPENHVAHLQFTRCGRTNFNRCDEDLAAIFRHVGLDLHPAQRPGRPKVVTVIGLGWGFLGEIDRRCCCGIQPSGDEPN